MCGLAGIILGQKRRSQRELDQIGESFTRLLLLSEHRGPHATGAAWVKTDGACQVVKHPLPARQFVHTAEYATLLNAVDAQVTLLMGHTRWPTRGSEYNPLNNHPLVAGRTLTTHNGHLKGVDSWFRHWGLPRKAEVDSELLAQLADRHTGDSGINLTALYHDLRHLEGRMSAVLVARTDPQTIILLKGNMPLEVRWHRRLRAWAYASEAPILTRALADNEGWKTVTVPAYHALVANTLSDIPLNLIPFAFGG